MDSDDEVDLRLSRDEALVLYELLARSGEAEALRVEDPAEQRALWNLECLLERALVEPLATDYRERLAAARARLRGDEPAG